MENPITSRTKVKKTDKMSGKITAGILNALADKQKSQPYSPTNLFSMFPSELRNIGYKELNEKEEILDNDIIRVAGKKETESLYCVIENAKEYRKHIRSGLVGKLEIHRK